MTKEISEDALRSVSERLPPSPFNIHEELWKSRNLAHTFVSFQSVLMKGLLGFGFCYGQILGIPEFGQSRKWHFKLMKKETGPFH